MKKRNCKITLGIGIFLIVLSLILIFCVYFYIPDEKDTINPSAPLGVRTVFDNTIMKKMIYSVVGLLLFVGLVLSVLGIVKWNSEEKQQLRKLKIEALKEGRTIKNDI